MSWNDKGDSPEFPFKKEYDTAVVIGRMEGTHFGHIHVLKKAAELAEKVIILCGSRNRAHSIKNPWRLGDREIMLNLAIKECIPELADKFKVIGIADYVYNNQEWAKEAGLAVVKELYTGFQAGGAYHKPKNVCLVGHKKDKTSFYLDMFPQWKFVEVDSFEGINATDLRYNYFSKNKRDFAEYAKDIIPDSVLDFMLDWRYGNTYKKLKEEFEYIEKYKLSWRVAPYAPTFVTTDSIVVESGHVLMIQRGGHPGKGTWALPGGFLDAASGETVREGALRELVEETKIDVPPAMLTDLFKKAKFGVFDHPDRDLRGRIVTNGFLIQLPSRSSGLSKVKGSDDAVKARWFPIYEIERMSEEGLIFSDHADIIFNMFSKAEEL